MSCRRETDVDLEERLSLWRDAEELESALRGESSSYVGAPFSDCIKLRLHNDGPSIFILLRNAEQQIIVDDSANRLVTVRLHLVQNDGGDDDAEPGFRVLAQDVQNSDNLFTRVADLRGLKQDNETEYQCSEHSTQRGTADLLDGNYWLFENEFDAVRVAIDQINTNLELVIILKVCRGTEEQ
eukprot:TRINITY_DN2779_c0_g1_i1.p1 TRINITY_DN2779_c0_g1~~TRINITY_DN2779_c0_g1_i1.p1  ORF type:complete len:193 (-),score=44.77 TRINITY_DN2779_c0_g1_i1:44-592(-)